MQPWGKRHIKHRIHAALCGSNLGQQVSTSFVHLPGICVLVSIFYVHDSLSDSSGREDCICKILQQLGMFGAPPKYPPGPRSAFSLSFWLHQAAKRRGQWCSPISRWFRAASSLFKHHPGPGMLRPYTNAVEVAGQLITRGEECTQHGAQCISDKHAHTRMYVCVLCVCGVYVCVCVCVCVRAIAGCNYRVRGKTRGQPQKWHRIRRYPTYLRGIADF